MASTVRQVHVVSSLTPSADVVGCAFVHQYYLILHKSPELVYRFYQEQSKLSRPDENGEMCTTTTMQAINEKILSFDYGSQSAEITTVDAQDSYSGGVLVLVTGYLTGTNYTKQKFTQSFFLAPQDTGFYVFNDVFRFVDDGGNQNENQTLDSDPEGPLSTEHDSSMLLENHVSETEVEASNDVVLEEEHEVNNFNAGDEVVPVEEEEAPVTEVVAEIPKDTPLPVEPTTKIEELPKKSYASILSSHHVKKAVKEVVAPFLAPTSAPLKTIQNNHEPILAASTPIPVSETVVSGPNFNENEKDQEVEDGYSIYIKNLPLTTTRALIESEFKKFGPIKANGVQVKNNKGFGYGFVEFEEASSVQSALEASPIVIDGRQVYVEEKRSTMRGNGGSRGRFIGPRGNGFRNDGLRGRGGYGGRGYGRGGDYGGRDFGNRNGSRVGSYQRVENGGRENSDGLLGAADETVKSTGLRVSAAA